MNVAILGATGHIAKNLITHLPKEAELFLLARNPEAIVDFMESELNGRKYSAVGLEEFGELSTDFDSVVNCVGLGTPEKLRSGDCSIFTLTERFDDLILRHITRNPKTRYINFSSGVLYDHATDSASPKNRFHLDLDSISESDAYRVAKLNSEAKHRATRDCCIFDLRLFSFFSHFIDMSSSYLLTELIRAISAGETFVTDAREVTRDYIHPKDLALFVLRCMLAAPNNCALDLYSREPVKKSEIIGWFKKRYGLRVQVAQRLSSSSPTKDKLEYVPRNHDAEQLIGFVPAYGSLECLVEEADLLLKNNRRKSWGIT
jgi:nucleoside-diphosphate-sugar epimerase